ncbi:MAG: hypothetical protein K0R09_926 [Clostridiales bacterium]|jgi:hypothetical protein|nr:hypothetical protein [Clostridiales bacterium]
MFQKKFAVILVLTFTLIISFSGGYIITQLYSKNVENQNRDVTAEAANLLSNEDLINENTQILKRLTYNKNGTTFSKEINEKVTSDILGMDKITTEKYFKLRGYNLIEFSLKSLIITKDIDSWPPGCFVIKGSNDIIAVYEVDDSGNLKLKENTDLKLENLPEEDRKELETGKIFESLDEAYWLIEEYSS